MVSGELIIQNFHLRIDDGEARPPGGEPVPIKILVVTDMAATGGLQPLRVQLAFTPEELEKFSDYLRTVVSGIVRPPSPLPPILPFNGGKAA